MTDSTTAARRVAALALIPTSVAVFGAGLAWASGHEPSAPSSSSTEQSPDPRLAAAQAKVDAARARLAALQAQVEARLNATASPSAKADSSALATSAAPTLAPSKARGTTAPPRVATVARTTAVATTAAPAPHVQTTTRASKKA